MVKKGRRLTIFGLLVAALVWLGVQGPRPDAAAVAGSMLGSLADPILADRFWVELQGMRAAIKRGDVRAAWVRQERAEEMLVGIPRQDPLHEQFALAGKKLREFLSQRLGQAEAELRIGRVLAAAAQLKPFAEDGLPLPGDFIEAVEARGLQAVMSKIKPGELPLLPDPIAPGRQVRVYRDGHLELGHVLKSSGETVTVKLRSATGMLYPELPGFRLGLVDPAPQEALDQSLRALHAGDSLLAGLWLALASDRGVGQSRRATEIKRFLGR